MKKRIARVSLVQNAKLMAALYLVLSLPMVASMAVMAALGGQGAMSGFALIVFPGLYAGCGFLFTLIGAWLYNLVAGYVGGFEYTTAEVGAN
jgi:hypothetical protein